MRKRERENPCGVCGHYHKYEEGEVCGVCGHRTPVVSDTTLPYQVSAFPSEILPEFLYLGSYDNASRAELLKTQGISRVLNVSSWCLIPIIYLFVYLILFLFPLLQFDLTVIWIMFYIGDLIYPLSTNRDFDLNRFSYELEFCGLLNSYSDNLKIIIIIKIIFW